MTDFVIFLALILWSCHRKYQALEDSNCNAMQYNVTQYNAVCNTKWVPVLKLSSRYSQVNGVLRFQKMFLHVFKDKLVWFKGVF